MIVIPGEGVQWDNLFDSLPEKAGIPHNLTLGYVMIMLMVDNFLYLALGLYIEGVFPGKFGIPLPWYFPFSVRP